MDESVRQCNECSGCAKKHGRSVEVRLGGDGVQTSARSNRKLRKPLRFGKVDVGSRDVDEADDGMAVASPQPWHSTQMGML